MKLSAMDGTTTFFTSDAITSTIMNTEMDNIGCTQDDLNLPLALRYIMILFGFVLIGENLLMIVTIAKNKELHTNTNILVASLAVSDVIIGLLCLQMSLISKPNGLRSSLGIGESGLRAFDSFASGANCGLIVVSMGHLAAVSVDRYLYILWPLHYFHRVTQRRVIAVAVGIWLVCIIYILIPVWLYSDRKYHENCFMYNTPNEYGAGPLVCFQFLCTIIICISTFGIARLALAQGRKRDMRRKGGEWTEEIEKTNERKQRCRFLCNKDKITNLNENTLKTNEFPLATVSVRVEPVSDSLDLHTARYNVKLNKEGHEHLPVERNLGSSSYDNGDEIGCCSNMNKMETNTNQSTLSFVATADLLNVKKYNQNACPASSEIIHNYIKTVRISTVPVPQHPDESNAESQTNFYHPQKSIPVNHNLKRNRKGVGRTQRLDKAKLKVLKFVVMMFGSYLICVAPAIVVLVFNKLLRLVHFSNTVIVCITLILFLNSGMNFVIMVHLNKTFRSILSNSFPCRHLKLCFKQFNQARQTLSLKSN